MKFLVVLILFVHSIQCQFDFGFNKLINTTKALQDIERAGDKVVDKAVDKVNEFFGNIASKASDLLPNFNKSSSVENEKFINETLSTMPNGLCIKEVPTLSLFDMKPENIPAGNGSDPTLSRIQVCCEGYKQNEHNFRKCDPICKSGCPNGVCAGPENCLCLPNYVKNLSGDCVETCPKSCQNGICDGDGKCICNEGYESAEPDAQFCIPKCSETCHNGNCTAPETCECLTGYKKTSEGCVIECDKGFSKVDGVCKPVCSKGCEKGECVAPDVCKCSGNLKLDITGTQCVGLCEKSCLNGVCSGPNECTCKAGYFRDNFDKFRCVPKCSPICVNSVCSAPNLCLCYSGYIKDFTVVGNHKCIKN